MPKKVNILNLSAVGFLTFSLAAITLIASNPEIRQLIGAYAREKASGRVRNIQDIGSARSRQRAEKAVKEGKRTEEAIQIGTGKQEEKKTDDPCSGLGNPDARQACRTGVGAEEFEGQTAFNEARTAQVAIDKARQKAALESACEADKAAGKGSYDCSTEGGLEEYRITSPQQQFQEEVARQEELARQLQDRLAKEAREAQEAAITATSEEDRRKALTELNSYAAQGIVSEEKLSQVYSQVNRTTVSYHTETGKITSIIPTSVAEGALKTIPGINPNGGECYFDSNCASRYCGKITASDIAKGSCQNDPGLEKAIADLGLPQVPDQFIPTIPSPQLIPELAANLPAPNPVNPYLKNYATCGGDQKCNLTMQNIQRVLDFGTAGYVGSQVQQNVQYGPGYSVERIFNQENVIASIKGGTALTAEGATLVALPQAILAGGTAAAGGAGFLGTVGASGGSLLTSVGAITTMQQTGRAATTQIEDPFSAKANTETALAGLSWLNLATADKLIKAFSAGIPQLIDSARKWNTAVTVLNLGADIPYAISTCRQDDTDALTCGGSIATVVADVGFFGLDFVQGQTIFGRIPGVKAPSPATLADTLTASRPDIPDPNAVRIATTDELNNLARLETEIKAPADATEIISPNIKGAAQEELAALKVKFDENLVPLGYGQPVIETPKIDISDPLAAVAEAGVNVPASQVDDLAKQLSSPTHPLAETAKTPEIPESNKILDIDPDNIGYQGKIDQLIASGLSQGEAGNAINIESTNLESWLKKHTTGGDIIKTESGGLYIKGSGDFWYGISKDGSLNTNSPLFEDRLENINLSGGEIIARGATADINTSKVIYPETKSYSNTQTEQIKQDYGLVPVGGTVLVTRSQIDPIVPTAQRSVSVVVPGQNSFYYNQGYIFEVPKSEIPWVSERDATTPITGMAEKPAGALSLNDYLTKDSYTGKYNETVIDFGTGKPQNIKAVYDFREIPEKPNLFTRIFQPQKYKKITDEINSLNATRQDWVKKAEELGVPFLTDLPNHNLVTEVQKQLSPQPPSGLARVAEQARNWYADTTDKIAIWIGDRVFNKPIILENLDEGVKIGSDGLAVPATTRTEAINLGVEVPLLKPGEVVYGPHGEIVEVGQKIGEGGEVIAYEALLGNQDVIIKHPKFEGFIDPVVTKYDRLEAMKWALIESERPDLAEMIPNPVMKTSMIPNGKLTGYLEQPYFAKSLSEYFSYANPTPILTKDEANKLLELGDILDTKGKEHRDIFLGNITKDESKLTLTDPFTFSDDYVAIHALEYPKDWTPPAGYRERIKYDKKYVKYYPDGKVKSVGSWIYTVPDNNREALIQMFDTFNMVEGGTANLIKAPAGLPVAFSEFKPKGDSLVDGITTRLYPDGSAEIQINKNGDSRFIPLRVGEEISDLGGGTVTQDIKGNYYLFLDEDRLVSLTTNSKPQTVFDRIFGAIPDRIALDEAARAMANGSETPNLYSEHAMLLVNNGYNPKNISSDTYYQLRSAMWSYVNLPSTGSLIKSALKGIGIGAAPLVVIQAITERDTIQSSIIELYNKGYYSPTLDAYIFYDDGKWYRVDTSEEVSELDLTYLETTDFREKGLMGIISGQHLTINQSTFESAEWKAFAKNVEFQTAADPYNINDITQAVYDSLVYNPDIASYYFPAGSGSGNTASYVFNKLVYAFSNRNFQNVLAKNLTICFDFAAAEQTYLATLGIDSQLAAGTVKFGGTPGAHAFLIITDKNGKKWIADPTGGEVLSYDDYIEKYDVTNLRVTPSMYGFTNPENFVDFTIGPKKTILKTIQQLFPELLQFQSESKYGTTVIPSPDPSLPKVMPVPVPVSGLTSKGTGECKRVSNSYCDGARMYELYLWYKGQPDGWWYESGKFTPAEFLAMILMAESTSDNPDPNLLKAISVATANQLWGSSSDHQSYCTTPDCEAGIFNFLGAYVQSAGLRYNGLISNDGNPSEGTLENLRAGEDIYSKFVQNGLTLEQVANDVIYNPVSKVYNNDVPTQWGSPQGGAPDTNWVRHFYEANGPINTTERCGIYYVGGGDIVFTNAQRYNWDLDYPCKVKKN